MERQKQGLSRRPDIQKPPTSIFNNQPEIRFSMKIMIACRETHADGLNEEAIRAIINKNIMRTGNVSGSWTLSTFRADSGISLYLILGLSTQSAALLADAIKRSEKNIVVDLWQEFDQCNFLTPLFP
jgi:hypothetical protein